MISTAASVPAGRKTPRLRNIDLPGPAGILEGVVNEGSPDARFAALVCHPHPLGGGTLHNKVVYHAMKVFNAPEWGFYSPVLRFNFRSVGRSESSHHGAEEAHDVLAALKWLEDEYALPVVVAGFSFGAVMALTACARPGIEVRAIAALGLPTRAEGRAYHYSFLKNLRAPKLFLSGDQDRFAAREELEAIVAASSGPKALMFVPGADHFFSGQLSIMQSTLAGWLKEQLL